MAQYLPKNFQGKKILQIHNIDSLFFKRMVFNDGNILLRIFAANEWLKYIFFQKIYFSKFSLIYTLSQFDKLIAEKITNKNNIRIMSFNLPKKVIKKVKSKNNILLFVGSLRWYPNKDGISWFMKDIFPKIKKQIHNLKFWIVGDYPANFKYLNTKDVTFFGQAKNLDRFYSRASLFIAPLRYGSGIKVKIIEAIAYNIPIVTTFIGVEGSQKYICKNHNLHIVDQKIFAEKTISLLVKSSV
jgi:glycosyltransferase involved in cell wall biosynthesis